MEYDTFIVRYIIMQPHQVNANTLLERLVARDLSSMQIRNLVRSTKETRRNLMSNRQCTELDVFRKLLKLCFNESCLNEAFIKIGL